MINKSLARRLENTTVSVKHSKRTLFVTGLFLALLFSSFSMIHLGQAQDNQMSPDWTSITHNFFPLSPATGITEPVITASMVNDESSNVSYVADPFLYHENNTWYMFFEVNLDGIYPNLPSDIGLATSSDGLHWTYRQIVIHDSFHLAYPYVFKYAGNYYMIPETFTENAVKLYEATNFPYSWSFVTNIVTGKPYVDSSIFEYNSMLWLYATTDDGNVSLFYSNGDLANPASWHQHPMSPIVTENTTKARGAGRVIVFDDNIIIRLAQDSSTGYGGAVRAFRVDTITTTTYAEHEISQSPLLHGSGSGWNKNGMHQLDAWYNGSMWIAAVDGVNRDTTENWTIGIYQSPAYEWPLTISTNYGTVSPGNGSYGADSPQTITATPPTPVPGIRYVWQGWTGTGTGNYTGQGTQAGSSYTASITMSGAITETASWKLQYLLTVNSAHGSAGPIGGDNGWFDVGNTTNAVVTPAIVAGTTGTQYVFTGWSGNATGTGLTSDQIVMNGPKTATADWKTQYYLNVSSAQGTTGGSDWYDSNTNATATLNALTVAGATGTQYVFTGWSGDALGTTSPSKNITMNGPKTATANWQTQYNMTFAQSGVGSDFFGTVLTVNDTNYGFSGYTTWANASDVYTFSYSPQLIITSKAKQCLLTGLSGNSTASTIIASAAATITGTYKTQYYLTTTSTYDSPLPANGWYDSGSSISAFIASPLSGNSGTQYVCTGWSGTGSVPPSGSASAISFTISAASNISWNWKTQYLVSFAVSPSGDGTTTPSGTNTWQDAGSISISGTSSYNYRFSSWSADTPSITFGNSNAATTTAGVSGPGNITANFVALPADTPTPAPARTPTPTNSPAPSPTASPTPKPTNSSPTPVPSQSTNSLTTNPYFYVLIVAIVMVGVTAAIMVMRKRKKL